MFGQALRGFALSKAFSYFFFLIKSSRLALAVALLCSTAVMVWYPFRLTRCVGQDFGVLLMVFK